MNNTSQNKKAEKRETVTDKPLPEQGILLKITTDIEVGVLVTTGAVNIKTEHKHAAPRGSPSKFKQ